MVDVCVVTLNKLSNEFETGLAEAIPISNLIVDNSRPLGNSRLSLGKAREHAIAQVTTDKFVFVDDDIILPANWYNEVMKYWSKDTGWLEGWVIPTAPAWYHKWTVSRFKSAQPFELKYGDRGFTTDTVIDTGAAKKWIYNGGLEDLSLTKQIMGEGLRAYRVPVAGQHVINYDIFEHYKQVRSVFPKKSKSQLVKYAARTSASGAIHSIKQRDPAIFYYSIKMGFLN